MKVNVNWNKGTNGTYIAKYKKSPNYNFIVIRQNKVCYWQKIDPIGYAGAGTITKQEVGDNFMNDYNFYFITPAILEVVNED